MSTNQKTVLRLLVLTLSAFVFTAGYLVTFEPTMAEKLLFTGKEEHQIDTETAMKYIGNFHATEKTWGLTAGYMGRNIFEKILSQDGCVGIRIYNAKMDNGSLTYVIVGVDGQGHDIIAGTIGEEILPCPPICDNGEITLYPQKQPIAMK